MKITKRTWGIVVILSLLATSFFAFTATQIDAQSYKKSAISPQDIKAQITLESASYENNTCLEEDNMPTPNLRNSSITNINTILSSVYAGAIDWGDYDNDGDLDLLLSGAIPGGQGYITKIYRNDGNDIFTDINANLVGVWQSAVKWGDYNNDGFLDIAISGATTFYDPITGDYNESSIIYKNNGNGTFTDIGANLIGLMYSDLDWGDYNNDGDLDLVITGIYSGGGEYGILYRNNGNDTFTDIGVPLNASSMSKIFLKDFDNDGRSDILILRDDTYWPSPLTTSVLYKNTLSSNNNIIFTPTPIYSTIYFGIDGVNGDVGDYDNDGDLDLILTAKGYPQTGGSEEIITKLYQNNGNGQFTDSGLNFINQYGGDVKFGDYNNDGYLDLIISGNQEITLQGNPATRLYQNTPNGFVEDTANQANLYDLTSSSIVWGDYNNDGKLDIAMTGVRASNCGFTSKSAIYKNEMEININNIPEAPQCLVPNIIYPLSLNNGDNRDVLFSWLPTSDQETPTAGLNYNIYIGNSSLTNSINIASPMAEIPNGWRKVSSIGLQSQNTEWIIRNIPPGNYQWSVQAIDTGFAGSPFPTCPPLRIVGKIDPMTPLPRTDSIYNMPKQR